MLVCVSILNLPEVGLEPLLPLSSLILLLTIRLDHNTAGPTTDGTVSGSYLKLIVGKASLALTLIIFRVSLSLH